MSKSEEERQGHYNDALISPWYAACEDGHAFWSGADRKTYKEAEADANKHDKDKHGGEEAAVVLSGTYKREVPGIFAITDLPIEVPTEEILDACVGKHISAFCLNGYTSDTANHCAHSVSHVLRLGTNYTCKNQTGGSEFGASIRVHEIFSGCSSVGKWADLPTPVTWGLIFITNPLNVNVVTKTMQNVANKHVGIIFGGSRTVYQYKNAVKQVVKQTPAEFGLHYPSPDNGLFFGTL